MPTSQACLWIVGNEAVERERLKSVGMWMDHLLEEAGGAGVSWVDRGVCHGRRRETVERSVSMFNTYYVPRVRRQLPPSAIYWGRHQVNRHVQTSQINDSEGRPQHREKEGILGKTVGEDEEGEPSDLGLELRTEERCIQG